MRPRDDSFRTSLCLIRLSSSSLSFRCPVIEIEPESLDVALSLTPASLKNPARYGQHLMGMDKSGSWPGRRVNERGNVPWCDLPQASERVRSMKSFFNTPVLCSWNITCQNVNCFSPYCSAVCVACTISLDATKNGVLQGHEEGKTRLRKHAHKKKMKE